MEYKLLGLKFNVINVILCIALGFLICAMLGYNNKKIIEVVREVRDFVTDHKRRTFYKLIK